MFIDIVYDIIFSFKTVWQNIPNLSGPITLPEDHTCRKCTVHISCVFVHWVRSMQLSRKWVTVMVVTPSWTINMWHMYWRTSRTTSVIGSSRIISCQMLHCAEQIQWPEHVFRTIIGNKLTIFWVGLNVTVGAQIIPVLAIRTSFIIRRSWTRSIDGVLSSGMASAL